MMDLPAIIRGFVIGFSIAAPVGPIGVLCIRRTLAYGRIAGLVSGLGAATADAIYGSLAALGLSFIIAFLVNQQLWLQLVGGAFLCYLGVRTFFDKKVYTDNDKLQSVHLENTRRTVLRSRLSDFASTFLLTLTNPLTILSFTAIFAGIGLPKQPSSSYYGMRLVAGVFLGSAAWWLFLTWMTSLFRDRFVSVKSLHWINRISGIVIFTFGVIALASSISRNAATRTTETLESSPSPAVGMIDTSGFARVNEPVPLAFPPDHGPHPDYLTEWWYITGNLSTDDGREFGYQLTFFRRSLTPPSEMVERTSEWATNQAYMGHFAITDVEGSRQHSFEKLSRGAAGLAGAESDPFRVWLYNWQFGQLPNGLYSLSASEQDLSLKLTLEDMKGPILHGEQGFSQKSSQPGQASMYYSLTHLSTAGTLQIRDQHYQVEGLSWMDHEFSTSALAEDQVGWDWFSFQLDDGSEVMLFQIRKKDGSLDPYSSGTMIEPDGDVQVLNNGDFAVQVMETWKSPDTSADYPSNWIVRIYPGEIELAVQPCLADQELNLSYIYWEGCVRIEGKSNGKPVRGRGYVELTGYAGPMTGEF